MKIIHVFNIKIFLVLFQLIPLVAVAQQEAVLENQHIKLKWSNSTNGYKLSEIVLNPSGHPISISNLDGNYISLYSKNKPDTNLNAQLFTDAKGYVFDKYKYIIKRWFDNFRPVAVNTAGETISFSPSGLKTTPQGITFSKETDLFSAKISWSLDRLYTHDILVEMRVKAKQSGYFSFATPTLFNTSPDSLAWAILPGYFQGSSIQPDLLRAYAYGQGIPHIPVIVRERAAGTLSPLIQNKQGITLAVIPEPGTAADPWRDNVDTRVEWRLGLSLMNRQSQLSPTLYHPVLGEIDSYMDVGEERVFRFLYSIQQNNWFEVYKHAVYDIYDFKKSVQLKNTHHSLTDRICSMINYLKDDSTSMWSVHDYKGMQIGAQAYMSGVTGADNDAIKNADYGAMWMLSRITGDTVLNQTRLRPARNFKLGQQQTEEGFFKGAATGQYYLWKSHRFTEEWGNYVEPIGLTYYTMMDIGNILLFEPGDKELKERLKSGADKLFQWQHSNGSWEVAYNRTTEQPAFTDQIDLRPTFYGLLVAYRILGDKKYLQGAVKGANWYVKNAVDKGHFLGVCGDVRFVPDFATVQSAQALLDLYDLTADTAYLQAAIKVAKLYTTSVYTHPIPSKKIKIVKGKPREDWEISQVGLGFEHGGTLGSANGSGPILLASHAGFFVRMAGLTGEPLFLDMARAAAWGRDAFVNQDTQVASYYWSLMDRGSGPFPHHAWWQVGWIMDYLVAEVSFRSNGKISFPAGFITPKVGPHQPYGFSAGKLFGANANLILKEGLIKTDNNSVDYLCAVNETGRKIYAMLLNNSVRPQHTNVSFNLRPLFQEGRDIKEIKLLDKDGTVIKRYNNVSEINLTIADAGLCIAEIEY